MSRPPTREANGWVPHDDDGNGVPPPVSSVPSALSVEGKRRPFTASSNDSEPLVFPWAQVEKDNALAPRGVWNEVVSDVKKGYQQRRGTYSVLDWLQMFLPCISWLRTYKIKEYLIPDLIAGLSVGLMVVPQGMSYANIAGLPSVYGLYGAFMPVLVYSLLGSSRQLAVGPVAVTSTLIGTTLSGLVPGANTITNPNQPTAEQIPIQEVYNKVAVQIAFLVACLYTAVGVLHCGFIINFLSHSVISGFMSGAAIQIGLSQIKYILGVTVPRVNPIQTQIKNYTNVMWMFKWQEFVMGTTILAIMVTMKEIGKRHKRFAWVRTLGPITGCIIGICAVAIGRVDLHGIKIVGAIPKGLPKPTIDWWLPLDHIPMGDYWITAIIVMLVDLTESTSIARALALRNKYQLAFNREITGLGLANFAGAIFNAYTTTGSFSRSAVNNDAGAKTLLSSFVTAWVVAFVLIFLTPVFSKLPYNVICGIILNGVAGLFDIEQAVYLWKVRKLDWCIWMAAFCGTLFISIEIGLAIAIGLALAVLIYETAWPHTALLGNIPNTTVYRNVEQYPNALCTPGVLVVRIDAGIYFANLQNLREKVVKYVEHYRNFSGQYGVKVQYIVLDLTPVSHIDAPAIHALGEWIETYRSEGVQMILVNPNRKVVAGLEIAGVPDTIGRDNIFVSMHDAVSFARKQLTEGGDAVQPQPIDPMQDRFNEWFLF